MATYALSTDHAHAEFNPDIPPAITVDPGDSVSFETDLMVLQRLAAGESLESVDLEQANAVIGPVFVRGAEPGDALRLTIEDVSITTAWSAWLPGFGPLGARTQELRLMNTSIRDGRVFLSQRLSVPLEPMVGCIGLAPAEGVGSTMRPVYAFGGNMDLRELGPGTTLWLPVMVEGALLSVGDFHAAMGHGEAAAMALEAAGTATIRIELERGRNLPAPRLRMGADTIIVALGADHVESRQRAMNFALDYLVDECGMDLFEAYAYLCARVGVRFGGPAGPTVLAVIPDPLW